MEETARNKKIEDFLLGRLDEADMQAFRLQLEQDAELQIDVKNYQYMLDQIDALYDHQASRLIKKVQQNEKLKTSNRTSIRRNITWLTGTAAAITLLFFIVQWFSGPSNDDLYLAYYEAYDLNFVQRGNTNDKRIVDAGTFYRTASYAKALPLLETVFSENPKNTHIRMAIGICHLEQNDYTAALQMFEPLIKNNDPLYLDQARWYTALALLKLNQIGPSKNHLQVLSTTSTSRYKQQAMELLIKLD